MKLVLKAMLVAGALGAGAFFADASPANAQYYHRPGVSVYIGVGARPYYHRRHDYQRSYYRDDWRWRRAYSQCHRSWRHGYWRSDCGRRYGWRGNGRRHYRSW